ncbi:hypothetical protein PMZ80_001341 [Knufia obscura]|uniref:Uncharacterized protein n=1 Tax=Knufia obscura TaxID=1635080 RepID=A0ABR0S3Z1_9EURO|nr:hypothetical protein PMZ80_001341 [Knufia obscura]
MPSSIFSIPTTTSHAPKVNISHTEIPQTYLDPTQPPLKRLPFRQIRNVPYVRDITLCMPTRIYNSLYSNSNNGHATTSAHPQTNSKPALPGQQLNYAKVIMTLSDILTNYDLRTGNHAMLADSSTPSSNDTTMHLNRGTITLDMPHPVYQRSGLTFPVTKLASGGRKHEKGSVRYRVEIDLRPPSMVKGKKGFERLVHAAGNVEGLREGRVWLFAGLEGQSGKGRKRKREEDGVSTGEDDVAMGTDVTASSTTSTPATTESKEKQDHLLAAHYPTLVTDPGTVTVQHDVLVSSIVSDPTSLSTLHTQINVSKAKSSKGHLPTILDEDIHELVEYLGLLFLASPRITKADYGKVDPYLCRYTLPNATTTHTNTAKEQTSRIEHRSEEGKFTGTPNPSGVDDAIDEAKTDDITTIRYTGFIPSEFVLHLVIDLIRRSREKTTEAEKEAGQIEEDNEDMWVAINVTAHKTEAKGGVDGYMILLQGDGSSVDEGGERNDTDANDAGETEGGMDVDSERHEQAANGSENEKRSKDGGTRSARGFRYVTCFEFVDSSQ